MHEMTLTTVKESLFTKLSNKKKLKNMNASTSTFLFFNTVLSLTYQRCKT